MSFFSLDCSRGAEKSLMRKFGKFLCRNLADSAKQIFSRNVLPPENYMYIAKENSHLYRDSLTRLRSVR